MRKIFLIVCLCGLCVVNNVYATPNCSGLMPACTASNCKRPITKCAENSRGESVLILECSLCQLETGYLIEEFTDDCNGISFTNCKKRPYCSSSNCVSDSNFSSYGTGYESKATRACSNNECVVTSRVYRCASGYYGSSSNGTSGCTRCPLDSKTGLYGSSSAGTTSITGCYQNSGRTGSDSTGTFVYTANCNYQN